MAKTLSKIQNAVWIVTSLCLIAYGIFYAFNNYSAYELKCDKSLCVYSSSNTTHRGIRLEFPSEQLKTTDVVYLDENRNLVDRDIVFKTKNSAKFSITLLVRYAVKMGKRKKDNVQVLIFAHEDLGAQYCNHWRERINTYHREDKEVGRFQMYHKRLIPLPSGVSIVSGLFLLVASFFFTEMQSFSSSSKRSN